MMSADAMQARQQRERLVLDKLRTMGYAGASMPSFKHHRFNPERPIRNCNQIPQELEAYVLYGEGDLAKVALRVLQAVRCEELESAGLTANVILTSQNCKDFIATGACVAAESAHDLAASILSNRRCRQLALRDSMIILGFQGADLENLFKRNSHWEISKLLEGYLGGDIELIDASARTAELLREE